MIIRKIRGSGTCSCVWKYEWDNSVGTDSRVGVEIINLCSKHSTINDPNQLEIVLSREHLTVSSVLKVLSNGSRTGEDFTDTAGKKVRKIKDSIVYSWRFSGDGSTRVLNFSLSGITLLDSEMFSISQETLNLNPVVVQYE